MATNRNWPSREAWAKERRTPHFDEGHPYIPSRELSLYASPEEIAAAIAALRMIWSDYGRQMKIASKEAGPLARRPHENTYAYDRRFWAMRETEQELAHRVDRWRDRRQAVSLAIRMLRQGLVPEWSLILAPPPSPLATIIARFDAAATAGNKRYAAKVKALPIDDAAWAEELKRRRAS
jgi:hypothetical protein